MSSLKSVLSVLGGVAAAVATGYVLYQSTKQKKDDALPVASVQSSGGRQHAKRDVETMTRSEIIDLLFANVEIERKRKEKMKILHEYVKAGSGILDLYDQAKNIDIEGIQAELTSEEFVAITSKYFEDPDVCALMSQIVQPDIPSTPNARNITLEQVINIHREMLNALKESASTIDAIKRRPDLQPQALIIAVQCYVTAQCEIRMNIAADDLDAAIANLQTELTTSVEFEEITREIQATLQSIVNE